MATQKKVISSPQEPELVRGIEPEPAATAWESNMVDV